MLRHVDNTTVDSALEPVPFVITPNSEEHAYGEVCNPSVVEEEIPVVQHDFCFGLVESEDVQRALEASPVAGCGGQSAVEEKKSTNSQETGNNRGGFQYGRRSGEFRHETSRGGRWEFNGRSDVMKEENRLVHDEEDVATSEKENRFLCKLQDTEIYDYIFRTLLCVKFSDVELCDKADPVMEGMDLLGGVKHHSYSDLKLFTNSFNEQTNLVCKTRYGRLFHGKIGKTDVLVKTWDPKPGADILKCFHTRRIADELSFLRHPAIKSHPNVVELAGYSCEKKLAVVYKESRPNCLLRDIIESDEFGWGDRLRVALQIASVVKTFHNHGHVHRGLFPECFTMTIHGEEGHLAASYDFNEDYFNGRWRGYYEKRDMCAYEYILEEPAGLEKLKREDFFGYGFLLMLLVSKSHDKLSVYRRWAESPPPGIHESFRLKGRERACRKIEKLVLDCLKILDPDDAQSSIDQVVEILEELNVDSCSEGVVNEEEGDKLSSEKKAEKMAWEDLCFGNGHKENVTPSASDVVGLKIICAGI